MSDYARTRMTVAFLSFSTLLCELVLTRVLSFLFWSHAVYLAVSVALLGFGISGTIVSLIAARREVGTPRALGRLCLGFGLTSLAALASSAWLLPVLRSWPEFARLFVCYVVYVGPFVCSGAALAMILSSRVAQISNLYAIDLLAAGLGCILFFYLLPLLGAQLLLCAVATCAMVIGVLWLGARDRWFYLGVGALLAGLGLTMGQALAPRLFELSPPRDKELGVMLGVKGTTIEKTIWTPISRIDVTRNDEVSLLKFPHPPGSFMVITQDATANTRLLSKRAIDEMATRLAAGQDIDTRSLVYRIKTRPKVAIIGVGGGMDVADALAHGAQSVLGIELNPATYRLANEIYADYNGHLMQDPRVTFVNEEGRSALRRRAQRFDVIQVIGIDTFAALSSGAYVLSENYLYTVEAFEDMFDRLEDGGILAFSRWLFHPPRESLRLSALACEAWKRRGQRDCESRIMVIGSESWALSLFKNGRFTAEEASAVAEKARLIGQVVLHWPRVLPGSEQITWQSAQAPRLGSPYRQTSAIFGQLMASYAEGREREFMNSYRYNIRPTTDDSPFFFEYHYLNVLGLPDLSGGGWRAEASASMTLYMILIEATVVSLLAIFLPLWRRQRKGLAVSGAAAYSAYFAALGFGFMLVEISLTQRCVLFLGSPLYALPVVLASVLMSAGLGSRIVAWRAWDLRRVVLRVGPGLLVLLLTLVLCLTPMLRALLFLPFWLRVAVTVGLTASAGLLMGMFFPTGLRSVGQRASAFVPWAWGINGCTSVYGSIAAIMAAMASGFQATLTLGVLLYLVACLAGWRIERTGGAGVKTS